MLVEANAVRRIEPRPFHGHSPVLSGPLSCSKMAQSLKGIVFAGTTRNHPALTAIPYFFYPVATPARNNNEVHHVYLSKRTHEEGLPCLQHVDFLTV
jgi:hypothetical protein